MIGAGGPAGERNPVPDGAAADATGILTVTPNPAYDVTYEVPKLALGEVHRVGRVHQRVGGKGINVTRVLADLGTGSSAICLGDETIGAAAAAEGIELQVIRAMHHVRRTVVVSGGDGSTTSFWEPGAPAEAGSADRLVEAVDQAVQSATGLVVSGSIPPNVEPDLPARLASDAIAHGRPVVVDVDNAALVLAAEVPGVVLLPNSDELARLVGHTCPTRNSVVEAGQQLIAGGVAAVVATRGADGLVGVTPHGAWHARLDAVIDGNPTGAGDAATAAVIRHLVLGSPWPDLLVDAVAVSGAAVRAPVAGSVDPAEYADLLPRVSLTPFGS